MRGDLVLRLGSALVALSLIWMLGAPLVSADAAAANVGGCPKYCESVESWCLTGCGGNRDTVVLSGPNLVFSGWTIGDADEDTCWGPPPCLSHQSKVCELCYPPESPS